MIYIFKKTIELVPTGCDLSRSQIIYKALLEINLFKSIQKSGQIEST